MKTTVLYLFLGAIIVMAAALAAAITLTSPKAPPMMVSVAAPFRTMNFSSLPSVLHFQARDGAQLAYRAYPAERPRQTVVLIHGSSASGSSLHVLAEYLQKSDMDVYALDMRGHGESGRRGDIDYVGQLEDDLEDFMKQMLHNRSDVVLAGFSSGGGFALRFAASPRQQLFSRYIALAPFIRYDAPTTRPNSDEWARASVPRIIALTLLGPLGSKCLGHLPVIAFGIDPQNIRYQTSTYSYRLANNFGLHYDYVSDLKAIKRPLTVIVGEEDELLYPQKYLSVFAEPQPHAEIRIAPGVGHVTLTTDPAGMKAVADAIAN